MKILVDKQIYMNVSDGLNYLTCVSELEIMVNDYPINPKDF